MKKKLPKNWQPDEEFFWGNNADKHQMTNYGENRSWCEHQLHGFKMYWCKEMGGSGKPMISWDLTYWNRCKVLWEHVDKVILPIDPKVLGLAKKIGVVEYTDNTEEDDDRLAKQTFNIQYSNVPHKQPETITTKPMSSEKRIEFAEYLSKSMNK